MAIPASSEDEETMGDAVLESTLTCPACGHQARERMPTDACLFFYECQGCGTRLKPKADAPLWVESGTVALTFTGGAGREYQVAVGDRPPVSVTAAAGGLARADVFVGPPGRAEICLQTAELPPEGIEGRSCLAFAVLP